MSPLIRLVPILCLLLSPAVARADAASDARDEIERRGIPYDMAEMCRAAEEGDVEVVRLFLDAGPNVNLRDWSGMTPLQSATLWHQPEVTRLLLERGADPNITSSHDETALHVAIEGGWNDLSDHAMEGGPEVVRAIVDAGANLDAQTDAGETPLIRAVRLGDRATFDLLVERGANLELKTAAGATALSTALAEYRPDMALVLFERGARASRWVRFEYWSYRFARVEGWSMPAVFLAVVALTFWIDARRPPLPKKADVGAADGLPRLEPLTCETCAAPVPIGAPDGRCPSCATPFVVPEDYEETARLRGLATENLRRAVRMWRRARLWNSPPVALFFVLLGPVWLVATYLGAGGGGIGESSGLMIASMLVGGWTFGASLFCYGLYLMAERSRVPRMPKIGATAAGRESAACTQCGGAVLFEPGVLVLACDFCGSDLYRAAIACVARRRAADEEHAAGLSAHEALVTLYDMRDTLVFGVFTAAFLVTGTAIVIVLVGVWEFLTL